MKLDYTVSREIDGYEIEVDLTITLYCEPCDRQTGTPDQAWIEEVEVLTKEHSCCFDGLTEEEVFAIERLAVAEMREGRKAKKTYFEEGYYGSYCVQGH